MTTYYNNFESGPIKSCFPAFHSKASLTIWTEKIDRGKLKETK